MEPTLTNSSKSVVAGAAIAALIITSACASQAKAPDPAPGAPSVKVVTAQQRDIPLETSHTGRVQPVHHVELRPRVGGALEAVLFQEGAAVPAGTPLFRIDRRPYEFAVRRAAANVGTVRAQLARARQELERAEHLAKADALAIEELERRRAEVSTLSAQLEGAEAAAADAALQLEFTTVRAPVAGRIGRAEVTIGNLVNGGDAAGTRLAVLQSLDPIYVYFDLDPVTAGRARETDRARWRATVSPLGAGADLTGPVDFVDTAVGDQTGTLKVRARLANPRGNLVPSSVVRVTFRHGTTTDAILVPEIAIGTEQGMRQVLVAGPDGTVEYRPVTLGAKAGNWRVITEGGVRAGEQIILPGMPGLRPGMKITPVEEVVR
jgi:RND family efflux transporter MFP subunit